MKKKPSVLILALAETQKHSGQSDAVFARRFGISRQAWVNLKSGESEPSAATCRAIAEEFHDLRGRVWDYVTASEVAS